MGKRPATFTEADVKRAIKAARAIDPTAVIHIGRDGSITIRRGEQAAPATVDADADWSF